MEKTKRDRISYLMEVWNAHPKACTDAALCKRNNAKGLLQALEGRFLNVDTIAEVTTLIP